MAAERSVEDEELILETLEKLLDLMDAVLKEAASYQPVHRKRS